MIRLLLAFDRGLDLDAAFDEVLGLTPEDVDLRFDAFVANLLEPLALEPAWSPGRLVKLRKRPTSRSRAKISSRPRLACSSTRRPRRTRSSPRSSNASRG
jgi:hypothetical protein